MNTMMINVKKGIYLAIICMVFISCKNENNIKIGFLIDSFETARWLKDKQYFEDKVTELGGETITKSAQGDENLQYQQAEELIESGIDVLVIVATNTNTAAAIVRKAHSKGIPVIAYARMIPNSDLDYYISFNVEKIGELQAKYITERKPGGNYVLINGDKSDINAIKEYNGVLSVLKTYTENNNIKILFSCFIDGWSPADASFYTEKILHLSSNQIDAIVVANDGMAESVIDVLKKNNMLDQIMISGLDADVSACARILKGEQSMSVYMSIKNIANTGAELAMRIAQKQKSDFKLTGVFNGRKDVPSIVLDPIIIDKNNIESTVVAEAFHTMDEIKAKM
jgi:D-xylose transport system substrate-binding protein